jgi:hypothetical protein
LTDIQAEMAADPDDAMIVLAAAAGSSKAGSVGDTCEKHLVMAGAIIMS